MLALAITPILATPSSITSAPAFTTVPVIDQASIIVPRGHGKQSKDKGHVHDITTRLLPDKYYHDDDKHSVPPGDAIVYTVTAPHAGWGTPGFVPPGYTVDYKTNPNYEWTEGWNEDDKWYKGQKRSADDASSQYNIFEKLSETNTG